ncbi:MAG TPA: 16S rRNA (cytosine(967)-C(5))-methyltransferase RsmB [Solirubrobacteraceae bacterium]|nr:16S rRNA (cytosine(967)-C(5))-methyltransferase RsmB [Solirubrobacteraceae bacterium]
MTLGEGPRARVSPARTCAYAVLRRVFEQGAYADHALRAEAKNLDARDRALAMRLAYGAIQRKGTLDHLIGLFAERPAERVDAPLLAALRLGCYELLYLDGAPPHAVVAGAVELAKTEARAGHGLVNAVLRRCAREGSDLLAGLTDRTADQAAIKHSHPSWLAELWWSELGADEARALMAADNEPSELAIRANTLVTDAPTLSKDMAAAGVPVRRDPDIPEALVLDGPFDALASRFWREGAFVAQSRGAMLVARALGPEPGEAVLDLCAAPGNKTTHLAALMSGQGRIVAVERDRRRAGALVRAAQRLHADNVHVELADAAAPRPEGPVFDRVLVDPPCSGLGTLQARPDLRWRASPERLAELQRVQASILAAGAEALRPGGVLVYSTCTISTAENDRQIASFLEGHPSFALDDLGADLPALRNPSPSAPETVLTLPHRDRTAGFFVARLRKGA